MAGEDLTDEYVANLLKEDAKQASKNYALGFGAFPQRSTINAPKPNTRFLRTILRETDSHNQALRAKEREEARARLKALRHEKANAEDGRRNGNDELRKNGQGSHEASPSLKRRRVDVIDLDRNRLSPPRESKRHKPERELWRGRHHEKRRRRGSHDSGGDEAAHRLRHSTGYRRRRREESSDRESHDAVDKSREKQRHSRGRRERSDRSADRQSEDRRKRKRPRERSDTRSEEEDRRKERNERSNETESSSRVRPRSRRQSLPRYSRREDRKMAKLKEDHSSTPDHTSIKLKPSLPLSSPEGLRLSPPPTTSPNERRKKNIKPDSDSDPLEELIGPLPPRPGVDAKIKLRGRGAFSRSAIDSHFDSSYDPTADVALEAEEQNGDWEQALEILRDRARYKKQHAERLRAAGFTEEEVRKWEKGGDGGEKTEEDVKWAKKGEGREWDRGKIFSADGNGVEFEAEWGRLKDN